MPEIGKHADDLGKLVGNVCCQFDVERIIDPFNRQYCQTKRKNHRLNGFYYLSTRSRCSKQSVKTRFTSVLEGAFGYYRSEVKRRRNKDIQTEHTLETTARRTLPKMKFTVNCKYHETP